MRINTLRKLLNYQLVAKVLSIGIVLFFTSVLKAQEIKAPIAAALASGDTTLAIDLINKDISIDKKYYLNYHLLGMIHYERSQFKEAVVELQKAVKAKKKDYESLYWLGMSQLNIGEVESALETFSKGKKKDKKNKHRFEDGIGQVYMKQDKCVEADKMFRYALVGEKKAEYHIHLGDANLCQGIPSLATAEYQKAIDLEPAGLEVYYHWAEACLEMKDYACAIEKLKVVLQKDSTHAPSWRRAAGIYYKAARSSRGRDERKTRFSETIGAYKRYLELSGAQPDSAHVRTYFELAMSYSSLNGFEDAVEYYEKVLNIPYIIKDIYFNYGKALLMTKKYVEGGDMILKHLEWVDQQDASMYKSSIKDYELYRLLGDSYYYQKPKDHMSAINNYKKSLEFRPEQKRLLQNIALGYDNLKSYAQALEFYEKRIELGVDEKSSFLYKYAGNCALRYANQSGNEDEDLEEEEEEVDDEEEDIDPMTLYSKVVDLLVKYLEFKPQDTTTVLLLASTYMHQLEDCVKGVKYYEMSLTLDPTNCDASKYLGYAYLTGKVCSINYTKAINYLKKAESCVAGGCEEKGLILGIAQAYHSRGFDKLEKGVDHIEDYRAAYKWFVKVLKCEPGHKIAKEGRDQLEFEI